MTKFLADENVPLKAVKALKRKGLDIVSVIELSPGLKDKEVLNLANKEERIIVTFDKDFGELVVRQRVKVKGLILLRFISRSSQQVAEKIWQVLESSIPLENNLPVGKGAHHPSHQTEELKPVTQQRIFSKKNSNTSRSKMRILRALWRSKDAKAGKLLRKPKPNMS